jgi:hypothetical protein
VKETGLSSRNVLKNKDDCEFFLFFILYKKLV